MPEKIFPSSSTTGPTPQFPRDPPPSLDDVIAASGTICILLIAAASWADIVEVIPPPVFLVAFIAMARSLHKDTI